LTANTTRMIGFFGHFKRSNLHDEL
jgi:hypothetical protein